MHGQNGSGKTTFVQDCFKCRRFDIPHIYIDTIEFYSEKLISIQISQQLNGILQCKSNLLKLDKKDKNKLNFRIFKNFSTLLEGLTLIQEQIKKMKDDMAEKYP